MYVPIVKSMGYLPMILIEQVTGRIIVEAFGYGKFKAHRDMVRGRRPRQHVKKAVISYWILSYYKAALSS